MTTEWETIETIPKHTEDGDVPWDHVVWLHDPDNRAHDRIQIGFWNNNYDGYQSLFEGSELMRPTHWRHVDWPEPPQ